MDVPHAISCYHEIKFAGLAKESLPGGLAIERLATGKVLNES
jgi:hypothetical protein